MFISRLVTRRPRSLFLVRFNSTVTPKLLDLRIGRIVDIRNHENADRLYVSQIQVEKPKGPEDEVKTVQVCSGLVGLVPKEELLGSDVVLLMNLKPSKMRGIKSEAMLLAAERESEQAESGFEVEVVRPPREGEAGQQVEFKGYERGGGDTTKRLKKKDWEEIAELLRTNEAGEVCFKEGESTLGLTSPGGIRVTCQVKTLTNSKVR